jgi:hypothetical protein
MRLYSSKIPEVAGEILSELTKAGDIEVGDSEEARLDVEAVLREYLRTDRELTERAKDILEQKKLPYGQFGKVKRSVAEEKGFGLGEEALNWICNQLLETFMHSRHVDEVFADDATLKRRVKDVLRKHMMVDTELDEEVRRRIKNLQEGTQTWEVEYAKVMEQIKRKHGIE